MSVVHPRVCGEAGHLPCPIRHVRGPSPRVRGSRRRRRIHRRIVRSIPACAGKPRAPRRHRRRLGVHPRVCGEAEDGRRQRAHGGGPSPRVRGSLAAADLLLRTRGSIPACAGKPTAAAARSGSDGVHPRVCGEAAELLLRPRVREGPSPRVRGSPVDGDAEDDETRSIPACAGKPIGPVRARLLEKVHPRVCGEAGTQSVELGGRRGPSPRVRGSLARHPRRGAQERSIPACAGKPAIERQSRFGQAVHPRVCGEATSPPSPPRPCRGPSPRVRGSLVATGLGQRTGGSIPACAGKPREVPDAADLTGVHPRVCGEAPYTAAGNESLNGPSPRVRGSRGRRTRTAVFPGSIPACAGKPSTRVSVL